MWSVCKDSNYILINSHWAGKQLVCKCLLCFQYFFDVLVWYYQRDKLIFALGRMLLFLPNSYVEILTPNVLGSKGLGWWLGHDSGALMNRISSIVEETPGSSLD